MNRIDLFLNALKQAFTSTGEIAPWPIHVATIFPYFSDLEAADLFGKLKTISRQKDSRKILKKLLISPAVAKALLMDLIVGLKVAKPSIPVAERVWFVEYIFDALEEMQAGDIFCQDGTNQMLTPNEAQLLCKQTLWNWARSKKEFVRSVYKASASAKALMWSLYFYGWDDIGYEIHGPYEVTTKLGEKYKLVITDFFDPKPSLLWKSMRTFPYNSIRVTALYDQKADLRIDIFCHFFNKGSLLDLTKAVSIEVNNQPLKSIRTVEDLSTQILKRVLKQHELIQAMSKEEIIKKYIESRYYAFRKWRTQFNEDWQPPKKVFDRIKNWGLIEIPPGKGPTWAELKKAFDPRTEYVPGQE